MSNWIPSETQLNGEIVDLLPLERTHFSELLQLATEKRIWEFYVFDGTDPKRLLQLLEAALVERENGTQYPFVIYHKAEKRLIGSTRFLDIQSAHRKLEIGWTWLHPDYWATAVNFECKLLLLTYSFEQLKAVRVQLKTDETNLRSRKAIEKIGGKFEGILRNDMLRDNGTHRHSAYYSIIGSEWVALKPELTRMYEAKK